LCVDVKNFFLWAKELKIKSVIRFGGFLRILEGQWKW